MDDLDLGDVALVDENHAFTEDFRTIIPKLVGEELSKNKDGQPIQIFDNIKDLPSLLKFTVETKKAYDRKLENVIQKPAEDATDEQKTAYKAALAKEVGAAEKAEDYEFFRPAKVEGQDTQYSEETEKALREVAFKYGVPNGFIKEASQVLFDRQTAEAQQILAKMNDEAQKEFEADSTSLKNEWLGDDLPKNSRIALKALQAFASADLKKLLDENKCYENASDLSVWRKCGVSPSQLQIWHNIGLKSLSAEILQGEGGGGETTGDEKLKATYNRSPQMFKG